MRVAIPVFIAGILIALTAFSLTGLALPGLGAGNPAPSPGTGATATPLRAIVTTLTATAPGAGAGPQRGASASPTPSPTPGGTAIASSEGSPLNAAQIVAAIQDAGMPVSGRDGRFTATVGGAQQQFSLFVFRSPSELQAEWQVQAGAAPRPRNGPAPPLAYWNQNAVLAFPEIANADAARRIADVFLSLP
jgi:hypothetical protein